MRIEELTLDGFKLWARWTTIRFHPRITAVVGPNGSGKSAIPEAIRWASGSRRWTAMRGEEMADVIFHGNDHLPPAQRALVQVLFDNADGRVGVDLPQVEISRELARDGASVPRIARTPVLLRKVAEVLAGTGFGDDGLSVIQQGYVDQILLGDESTVSHAIEEAAGIARYRMQIAEARRQITRVDERVCAAEAELPRMKRERTILRREASRAERREQVRSRLAAIAEILRANELRQIQVEVATLEDALDRLRGRERELTQARDAAARKVEELQREIAPEAVSRPDAPPALDESLIPEIAEKMREVGAALAAESERLLEEGPDEWPGASRVLRDAGRTIEDLLAVGGTAAPARSPQQAIAELTRAQAQERGASDALIALAAELRSAEERLAQLRRQRDELAGTDPALLDDAVDARALAAEAEQLKAEDAQLDHVDPNAPHKYQELDREIARIHENAQDLKAARERLGAAVEETEAQARVLFADALARAGSLFDGFVRRLFGGGEARLIRRAAGEVAVHVRLPGKRECALTLLSGGEKSLAGVALAIAIAVAGSGAGALVLDEADHALDDANAARLAEFLREIGQTHQIILVTHNPITMNVADRIVAVRLGRDRTAEAIELDSRAEAPWLFPVAPAPAERPAPLPKKRKEA